MIINTYKSTISNKFLFCKLIQNNRFYKTLSNSKVKIRHHPPAIKEWNNSVYNYNKINTLDLPLKDNTAKSFIKSYLNLVDTPKMVTKSERMRTLIRRSSVKKTVFIGKPEVKQANGKAIITVYIFNRQKQLDIKDLLLKRKRLILNRKLNTSLHLCNYLYNRKNFYNNILLLYNNIKNKRQLAKLKLRLKIKKLSNTLHPGNATNVTKRFYLKKEISSSDTRKTYYSNLLNKSLLNKKFLLKNLFMYRFLVWALSLFKIRIWWSMTLKRVKTSEGFKTKRESNMRLLFKKGRSKYILLKVNKKHIFNINDLNKVNYILLMLLISHMNEVLTSSLKQEQYINLLYRYFSNSYYKLFINNYIKREMVVIKSLNKSFLSIFKLEKYMPFLKTLVKKIYNKKIEFNLVDHKYLHLNSDTFSEAIAVKLRKKKGNALRVLKKSMKLVKIPEIILQPSQPHIKPHDHNENRDLLHCLFEQMHKSYSIKLKENFKYLWITSMYKVLSSVKYKWTTGVRIEARGRLTRRFTASRAVFKFKYKGNLKNLDNIVDNPYIDKTPEELKKSPKMHMLRREFRPNVQQAFAYSNKRIGSFGIKGWISGS